jgi:membrane dipeptidase
VIFSHSSARGIADVPPQRARRHPGPRQDERRRGDGDLRGRVRVAGDREGLGSAYAEFKRRTAGLADMGEVERIMREEFAKVKAPKATLAQVADHVEHVRKVAGADHVGLGGDYDGNDNWPVGLEDVSKYPDLFAELVRRGWSDEDLKKLANGNILRVMRGAEAAAKRLQAARRLRPRPSSGSTVRPPRSSGYS